MKRIKSVKGIAAILTVLLLLVAGGAVLYAVHDLGIFQLDGDLNQATCTNGVSCSGDDWDTLFNSDGSQKILVPPPSPGRPGPSNLINDVHVYNPEGVDHPVFASSDKDTDDVSSWQWSSGTVDDKDTLENGIAAAYTYTGTSESGGVQNGDLIVYFGLDKYSNNGTTDIGFWFFKNTVGLNSNGTFSGTHACGDLLIVSDYTGGGSVSDVNGYTWWPATCGAVTFPTIGGSAPLLQMFTTQDCRTVGSNDFACGTVNSVPIANFFPHTDKSAAAGTTDTGNFYEGGVDLTYYFNLTGGGTCLAGFMTQSRSSDETSAELKDFGLGSLSTCSISASKSGPALSKIGDALGYTISVQNTGGSPLYMDTVTDTIGTHSAVNLVSGGVDATSGALTTAGISSFVDNCPHPTGPAPNALIGGATCTITYNYAPQSGDGGSTGTLLNTVNITYRPTAAGASGSTGSAITPTGPVQYTTDLFVPSVAVTKCFNAGPYNSGNPCQTAATANVGDSVTYYYSIANTTSTLVTPPPTLPNLIDSGAGSDTGDGVTDNKISLTVPAACNSLATGATCSFTAAHTVVAGDFPTLINNFAVQYNPTGFTNVIAASTTATLTVRGGNLTIVKTTAGGTGTFSYTGTGTGVAANFGLTTTSANVAVSTMFNNIAPTSYTVAETVPTNWDLTALSCSKTVTGTSTFSTTAVPVPAGSKGTSTVNLGSGDTVTCSYTNTERGALTIVKNAAGGDGTFSYTGSTGLSANFGLTTTSGTASTTFNNLVPGTYMVTESAEPNGWQPGATPVSCINNTNGSTSGETATAVVPAGQTVTCTYNNVKQGALVIVKNAVGADGTFSYTGSTGLPANFGLSTTSGTASTIFNNLSPGTYMVTESMPSGWQAGSPPLTCVNNGTGGITSGETATAVVPAGQTVTCTYNNVKQGALTIIKNTIGGDGTFSYTASLPSGNFSLTTTSGTMSTTFNNLSPGSYTVTELAQTGWQPGSPTALMCTNNGTGGTETSSSQAATAVVQPGQTVICTYYNVKQGSLTIIKDTVGGDGTFSYTANVPSGNFSLTTTSGTQSTIFNNLSPGTYTVTELGQVGWQPGSPALTCMNNTNGAVSGETATAVVPPGQNVTCTYNNLKLGSLTIVKDSFGGNATFSYTVTGAPLSDFTIATSGASDGTPGTGMQQYLNNVPPGMYTVSETADPTGIWAFASLVCTGAGGSPSTPSTTNSAATIVMPAGGNVTCTYANTSAQMPVTKVFNNNPTAPTCTDATTGGQPFTITSVSGGGGTVITVTAPGDSFTTGQVIHITGSSYAAANGYWFITVTTPGSIFTLNDSTAPSIPAGSATSGTAATTSCTDSVAGAIPQFTFRLYGGSLDGGTPTSNGFPASFLASTVVPPLEDLPGITNVPLSICEMTTGFGPTAYKLHDVSIVETPFPGFDLGNGVGNNVTVTPSLYTQSSTGTTGSCFDVLIPVGTETFHITADNQRPSGLIVTKTTIGGTGSFSYSGTGTGLSGFTLTTTSANSAVNTVFTTLTPGTYSVTENIPTNWSLTGLSCSTTSVGSNTSSTLSTSTTSGQAAVFIGVSDVVTCNYSNTEEATLVVTKSTVGGSGTFSYTGSGSGVATAFGLTTTTAGTAGSTSTTFNHLVPGSYSVTELATANWNLTGLSCSITTPGSGTSSFAGTSATGVSGGTLGAGDTVTCNYANTEEATLVVTKSTVGGSGTFSYTGSGSGVATAFGLTTTTAGTAGSTSTTFNHLVPGSYSVTELATANWNLTGLSCSITTPGSGTSSFAGTSATGVSGGTLGAGDTVTCNYANTEEATLVVTKSTVGGSGTFSYTGSGSGVATAFGLTTTTAGTAGSTSTTFNHLVPGSYSVTELATANWNLTGLSCSITTPGSGTSSFAGTSATGVSGGTLGAGDTVTCNYANTEEATLVVTKSTVGGSGTFSYTGSGSGVAAAFGLTTTTAGTAGSTSTTFNHLVPGSYSVTELATANWNLTGLSCSITTPGSGTSSFAGTSATGVSGGTLGAGDTVTCNYANTKQATLIVQKTTLGGTGTFSYTTMGTGLSSFGLTTTSAGTPMGTTFMNLVPGTYSVTETGLPITGWDLTGDSCLVTVTGAGGSSGTGNTGTGLTAITLNAGDTLTCTYTNTKRGALTIIKSTTGGDGTFSYTASVPSGNFSLTTSSGTMSTMFNNLVPGSYTVTETAQTGWQPGSPTALMCTNNGTGGTTTSSGEIATAVVQPGQTVTCTYYNVKQGMLTIIKNTMRGNGTFSYTANVPSGNFSLTTTSGTASTVFNNLSPGTYTVTEGAEPTGWQPGSPALSCMNNTNGSVSGEMATAVVPPGGNVSCTYNNVFLAPPSISKAYSPASIAFGSTSTMTFTITNPNAATALSGVGFTDNATTGWPAGLVLANTTVGGTCKGLPYSFTITPVVGPPSTLSVTNGTLAAGASCTITLTTATTVPVGTYTNTTSMVCSTNAGCGNTGTATLTVLTVMPIIKHSTGSIGVTNSDFLFGLYPGGIGTGTGMTPFVNSAPYFGSAVHTNPESGLTISPLPFTAAVCEIGEETGWIFNSWTVTFMPSGISGNTASSAPFQPDSVNNPQIYCINLTIEPGTNEAQLNVYDTPPQFCSPGYWKQSQHFHSYPGYNPSNPTGVGTALSPTPYTLFGTVFTASVTAGSPLASMTLEDVLSQGGGGFNALGRDAVNAYLDSLTLVNPAYSTANVLSIVNGDFTNNTPNNDPFANVTENCPLN